MFTYIINSSYSKTYIVMQKTRAGDKDYAVDATVDFGQEKCIVERKEGKKIYFVVCGLNSLTD